MPSMANQIKYALAKTLFKHPYKVPSEVIDYVDPNRYVLRANMALFPGINADRDVPAGNTYNTAQMQKGVDRSADFEVLGTNAVTTCVAHSTAGGWTLTTTTGANDQVIIAPHLNSGVSAWTGTNWSSDKSLTFETVVVTGASVAAVSIWAGFKLTNTSVVATDDDQAFFRVDAATNSARWQFVTSRSGTDNVRSAAANEVAAIAASTKYRLRMVINAARQVRAWINDYELKYLDASSVIQPFYPALTTGINFIPYVGIQTTTTAAKAMDLRGLVCSRL